MTAEHTSTPIAAEPAPQSANSLGSTDAAGREKGHGNPTAFWLCVAGLAIQALAVVMVVTMYGAFSGYGYGMFGMMGYYGGMMGPYYGAGGVWLAVAVVALAIGILGAALMDTGNPGRLRNGAVLVLLSAVFAFPTMWGFWVGSILMFIGAIMALTAAQAREPNHPA